MQSQDRQPRIRLRYRVELVKYDLSTGEMKEIDRIVQEWVEEAYGADVCLPESDRADDAG